MTKEDFEILQSDLLQSGKSVKAYLQEAGVSYSTYNYWRKKVATQTKTIEKPTSLNKAQDARIKELTAQVAWLNRQLFGRKSEKMHIIDPRQLDLFFQECTRRMRSR